MTSDELREKKRVYMQKWVRKNPDKVKLNKKQSYLNNKDKDKARCKIWRTKNKDYKALKDKEYRELNKVRVVENKRLYYLKNRDRLIKANNARSSFKRKTDILYRLKGVLRTRIVVNLIQRKYKKSKKTEQLLGADIKTVQKYLETLFLPGMSWKNHGIYGWHIDHIIPLASAKTEIEVMQLFHYKNLQPLWAKDNLKKGSRTA